jgi:hypothetical protein
MSITCSISAIYKQYNFIIFFFRTLSIVTIYKFQLSWKQTHRFMKAVDIAHAIIIPTSLLLGLTGNLLTICVMNKKSFSKLQARFFLLVLYLQYINNIISLFFSFVRFQFSQYINFSYPGNKHIVLCAYS